ncbi:MAG: polysaccharide deacetylase family protein [Pseudomonadota bacterium]
MLDPITARLLRNSGHQGSIVLMYHSMTPGTATPSWRYAVSRKNFCAQLDLLKSEGWQTYRLDQLIQQPLPPRSVVITFDDGYQDNFVAFEELIRRNMTASWFIVSRDIGEQTRWRDPGTTQARLLNASQLRDMHAAGIEIGAHSHRHLRLPECDDETLATELSVSKSTLEELLATPINSMAYPYGAYDERVITATRAAGYLAACTTRTGWALAGQDALQIRRLSIYAQDKLGDFARKLTFADNEGTWRNLLRYARHRVIERISKVIGPT